MGAILLRQVADFRPSLERVRDVIALAVFAGVLSTMVSATVGVGSLLLAGDVTTRRRLGRLRTLVARRRGATARRAGDHGRDHALAIPPRPGRPLEALLLAIGLAGASFFVFYDDVPRAFLVFPFLIWAALRFWQPGAVAASLVMAAFAIPLDRERSRLVLGTPPRRAPPARPDVPRGGVDVGAGAGGRDDRAPADRGRAARYISETSEGPLPAHLPDIPGDRDRGRLCRPATAGEAAGRRQLLRLVESGDRGGTVCSATSVARARRGPRTGARPLHLRADAVHESGPAAIRSSERRHPAPGSR